MRASNHEGNFLAVLNRQVDVATCNSEMTEKIRATAPEKLAQIRILWTSPLIARDPLVWRKDLPADLKARIRSFVVGYGKTPREKEILKNMYRLSGFKASSDAQLIPTRQLELAKDRARFLNDEHMSEADKKARVAEIDAKLAALTAGHRDLDVNADPQKLEDAPRRPPRTSLLRALCLGARSACCWSGPGRAPRSIPAPWSSIPATWPCSSRISSLRISTTGGST